MDRPEQRNAVNDRMHTELSTLFADLQRDPRVRAVVLTGAGAAFSVGGDTDPDRAYAGGSGLTPMQEARRIIEDLIDLDKPFLCAVNGHAIGLGATVASLADISLAVPGARFGDAHVLAALPAGNGSAVIWPLLVGINRAKRLLMAGELISTDEAVDLGLLSELAPAGEVLARTVAYAERLAALAPRAVRGTKAAINVLLRRVCDASLPLSLALEEAAMGQPEFAEALRSLNRSRQSGPSDRAV